MMEHYYKNIDGWFGFRHQYEFIMSWMPENGTWVELGCYQGRSLCWVMVEKCNSYKNFNVYAIDSWPTDDDEQEFLDQVELGYGFLNKAVGRFKETMRPFDGEFTPIKSISWEAADHFEDGSVDYIMIDAGHDYNSVTKDIKAWWPKIKSGGYMGGDDYDLRGGDVQSAVDGFVTANNLSVVIKPNIKESKGTYSKGSGNWLIQKP